MYRNEFASEQVSEQKLKGESFTLPPLLKWIRLGYGLPSAPAEIRGHVADAAPMTWLTVPEVELVNQMLPVLSSARWLRPA